jgi:hypothetical protein
MLWQPKQLPNKRVLKDFDDVGAFDVALLVTSAFALALALATASALAAASAAALSAKR